MANRSLPWARSGRGGIANLFFPTGDSFQSSELAAPAYIYAANPAIELKPQSGGNLAQDEPSQRPYQTISALYDKMRTSATPGPVLTPSFPKGEYPAMIADVLAETSAPSLDRPRIAA